MANTNQVLDLMKPQVRTCHKKVKFMIFKGQSVRDDGVSKGSRVRDEFHDIYEDEAIQWQKQKIGKIIPSGGLPYESEDNQLETVPTDSGDKVPSKDEILQQFILMNKKFVEMEEKLATVQARNAELEALGSSDPDDSEEDVEEDSEETEEDGQTEEEKAVIKAEKTKIRMEKMRAARQAKLAAQKAGE